MPYPQKFIDSVRVSIQSHWYEPEYVSDLKSVPRACFNALKEEPDFAMALEKRKGIMFDLLKQVCGCIFPDTTTYKVNDDTKEVTEVKRKGKQYAPKPQYYQFFAYTAYALLHSDISRLNWREPYNRNLQGQDVLYAMNKYGIYGLTEKITLNRDKKLLVNRFAALYARMFNADPRFQGSFAEPAELKIETRESPMTYCSDCGTIRKAWDYPSIAYRPGDPEYADLLSKFKSQIATKIFEKSTEEDQERYLERNGTLLNLDVID